MERDRAEEIISEYMSLIYAVSLRIVKNPDEAEDLVQEICFKIYQSLPGFKGLSSIKTWIYRLSVNACIDYLRKKKRMAEVSFEELTESGYQPAVVENRVSEEIEEEELNFRVQEELSRLPLEFRLPLIMKTVDGLSYEEIAEVLKVPLGTVKSRVYRARVLLRGFLFSGEPNKIEERQN